MHRFILALLFFIGLVGTAQAMTFYAYATGGNDMWAGAFHGG